MDIRYDVEKSIVEFENLLGQVKREGMDNLISFIKKSDFYTAPASTRYHSNFKGGLLIHSLNVYDRLYQKLQNDEAWFRNGKIYSDETLIIVALLHDICKTFFYKETTRNQKNDETGKWEKVPYYTVEDKFPFGHGEKSVFMIERYIRLTKEEAMAIRWHMGAWGVNMSSFEDIRNYDASRTLYPLVTITQTADGLAAAILERTQEAIDEL